MGEWYCDDFADGVSPCRDMILALSSYKRLVTSTWAKLEYRMSVLLGLKMQFYEDALPLKKVVEV
jgi:hypothetical protein